MSHVFISYKHGDFEVSDFLHQLEDTAKSAGITIWRDTNIRAGENWEIEIDSAIDDCFALLLILSENVTESQYVTYEWTRALISGKPVIPLHLSEKSLLHPRLEKTQYIDFTQNIEPSLAELIARLRALQGAYDENQKKQRDLSENETRRFYILLKDLYDARITQVTAEDILTELRSHQHISLQDYARLIDLSRKNKLSSDNN